MVGMGYRTIKTAVGAGIAMWFASLVDIQFATFAAILVIMCIERTKKRTIYTIKDKFFACLLSLVLGMVVFELLGYHPIVFAIFILLFIPILMKARIQNGFITSMVVLSHIYMIGNASFEVFFHELFIILTGIGIAFIVNSVMPSMRKDIDRFKYEIEEKYAKILYEFHAFLKDNHRNWDGQEINEAEEIINQAKSMAIQDIENNLLQEKRTDYHYFRLREEQLAILRQMLPIIGIVSLSEIHVEQREMVADLFLNISENVRTKNIDPVLEKLESYEEIFRENELPKTREEFEVRANLFYLLFEIKNYLLVKKKVMRQREPFSNRAGVRV